MFGGSTRLIVVLAVVLAPLVCSASASAAPRPVPGEQAAFAAVKRAERSGSIDRASAAADRKEIARAVHLVRVLPHARGRHVEIALEQVVAMGRRLLAPRALALFGQLRANDQYFARHSAPQNHADVTDSDGVVYRYFTGLCFEFHPLANFSALNVHVSAKDAAATEKLANALLARGVYEHGGGAGWEYYFHFEGGRPPWISGMAQSVAAQAFARAAALVPDESAELLHEASAAYRTIPGRLTATVAAGPWIRLYSFKSDPVLNAQLQSVLSLETYASATGDAAAATLAAQMEQAAAATVSRFDTGYWLHYSLAGGPSPLSYAKFVIRLLHRLSPADSRFATEAGRFSAYLKQAPAFELATTRPGAVRFWLSKPAFVRVTTGAGRAKSLSLGSGWHTLRWPLPKRAGIYGVHVTAVGPAGHRTEFEALPIVSIPTARPSRPVHGRRRRPSATGAPAAVPLLAAGVGIDSATQATQAAALGLRVVRISVPWTAGETAPDSATVASLQSLPTGTKLVLELSAAELPTDDAGRQELGGFATSLADQVPALHDLVLTPAPSLATAIPYADALAEVRAEVEAAKPDLAVGPLVDGAAAQAGKTAAAVANELVREGETADVVAFRPAAVAATGNWTTLDLASVESVIGKRLHAAPPLLLYAVPVPTVVPASELSGYSGGAPPTEGAVSPLTQATSYAAAIGSASCSPSVTGLLLDRLVDAPGPEPATGLYYAGGDAKPAAAAVAKEIAAVARGNVVCPGLAATVTPTALTFPTELGSWSPVSVSLGCNRDCLYLVTLDRANGTPVVARRGALHGGDAAQTIALPSRKLSAGDYRVDVRLVSRVDPGTVTRRASPLLSTA